MKTPRPDLKGAVVDRWWPYRYGSILKQTKTRVHVQWHNNGEVWKYDQAHAKFLRKP